MSSKILFLHFAMLLACITVIIGCSASGKKYLVAPLENENGNIYGNVIDDSVASIILNAKRITCELVSKSPEDSVRTDTVKVVPRQWFPLPQFLFLNDNNFKSNDIVYGQFATWACLKFESRKHRTVYLDLDFGLAKWRLRDGDMNDICTMDMKENNMQFLRFVRLLFPSDKTLTMLYNNYSQIK